MIVMVVVAVVVVAVVVVDYGFDGCPGCWCRSTRFKFRFHSSRFLVFSRYCIFHSFTPCCI